MEFKSWLTKTEAVHRPQEPNFDRNLSYEPPDNIPQPVGTQLRDPEKPQSVRDLEKKKAKKLGKPYRKKKDAIDVLFTGK